MLPMLKAYEWSLTIFSRSSWSERPSNWSMRCGEVEDAAEEAEEEAEEAEEEAEGGVEVEGERRETPNEGNPVCWLWRGQRWAIAVVV